ncbi:MAG: NAD-dependent epimerase/dehydratase family protein [Phycisphaerales bacterium]|jgi:UDP-glucose 4-epimerase|nr:NAD-dependent epimerase/dehydratase family protein [Phycisphaerales bacterium]
MPAKTADWTRRTVLVTGGAGFIGTHLTRHLVRAGAAVRVLDDLSSGSRAGLPDDVSLHMGSVTDPDAVARAAEGADAVAHLAAMVSVPECQQAPEQCRSINVEGTRVVADAAAREGATLVLASSCAVYGDTTTPPCRETAPPAPASRYAQSKADAEQVVLSTLGRAATCLRLFNVLGAGQRADVAYAAVAPIFAEALLAGRPLQVHGDGLQTRDLVPVGLAVEAMCRAAIAPTGGVVNVGTGTATSIAALITLLEAATGRTASVVHTDPRPADIRASWACTERLQARFGLPGVWADPEALMQAVTGLVTDLQGSPR